MLRVALVLVLASLACDDSTPEPEAAPNPTPTGVQESEPEEVVEVEAALEPESEPEPPAEPLAGHLDAHRMQGPARSLCGVLNRMSQYPVECDQIGLREREGNLLKVRESLEPNGPWLAVHFVELYDEDEMESVCGLLVKTSTGWWAHALGKMQCAGSGSTRIYVGAELRWEPMGPEGSNRLVVEISEGSSHWVEGGATDDHLLICGEAEGRVACHWMHVGSRSEDGVAADPDAEDYVPAPADWGVEVAFLPNDRIRVGEHVAPDGARRPPAPGLYEIRFDVRAR